VWYLAIFARKAYSPAARRALVVAGTIAVSLPTILLYRLNWASLAEHPARFAVAPMALAGAVFALAVVGRSRLALLAAPAAVLLALLAIGHAGASGSTTIMVFRTTPNTYAERANTLSVALQLTSFMKRNGFQKLGPAGPGTRTVPAFWYDIDADAAFNAMNSMYLWSYTAVGYHLPTIDSAMRGVLDSRRPPVVVLLCQTRACAGARAALAQAGYPTQPVVERLLSSGDERAWAIAVRLPKFAT
jgi:hypothetical protein